MVEANLGFKQLGIRQKLLVLMLSAGLLPLLLIAVIQNQLVSQALMDSRTGQLEAVREIKRGQLERFFAERRGDLTVLVETVSALRAEAFAKLAAVQSLKKSQLEEYIVDTRARLSGLGGDPSVAAVLQAFVEVFAQSGQRVDTPAWRELAQRHDVRFKKLRDEAGWYDFFLIDAEGHVVYTVARESDLGQSLAEGALKEAGLGLAYAASRKAAAGETVLVDLAPYGPSNNDPAAFLMTPLFGQDGQLAGHVALQLPLDRINRIMLRRDGMGRTGESYLVGADGRMRSDSFLDPQGHSVRASFAHNTRVTTVPVQTAQGGKAGADVITDYNGHPVLSVWSPVDLGNGVVWTMLSEVDVAEAFSPVDDAGNEYYRRYQELYGYYDLFLIHPDGYVFYSATREPDFQTNMLTGPYADSGLGRLVRRVRDSRAFGFADFSPYAPSKGAPAAFIAAPLVKGEQVELIVALQVSLDSINAVMQERTGMGTTGETYLVGPDGRMRSDSLLDPKARSVAASFSSTGQQGAVDHPASRAALAGERGVQSVVHEDGETSVSAHAPLPVFDVTWAVLAELRQSEVMAPIHRMALVAAMSVLGLGVVLALVARHFAKGLSTPLHQGVALAQQLASGRLTARMSCQRSDEFGVLAQALNGMAESLSRLVGEVRERMAQLAEASATLQGVSGNLSDSSTAMSTQARQVAAASVEMSAAMEGIAQATGELNQGMDQVARQAEDMSHNMSTISAAAEEASVNLATVASATEQATTNISHVNDAAQRTGDNVGTVAHAVEEISMSISGIRERCAVAARESEQAAGHATSSFEVMQKLDRSAMEIGEVIKTIKDIADQTNMLALNASIEAAGAGEAGKGFAVVANEVKDLARQTTEATKTIATQVGTIQADSRSASEATRQVSETIRLLQGSNGSILESVEEQSHTMTEIARSMEAVTRETREVTQRVAEANQGTQEVARSVVEISAGIAEVTRNVVSTSTGVEQMSRLVSGSFGASGEISRRVEESTRAAEEVAQSMTEVNRSAESLQAMSGTVRQRSRELGDMAAQLDTQLRRFEI
ncbi:MAG: methyl-accepting chemotaxis protein [Magnetococcus sp. WYHC-3]